MVGETEARQDTVADEVCGRFVAGEQEEDASTDDLVRGKRLVLVACRHQSADQVAAGLFRALLDKKVKVLGHGLGAVAGAGVFAFGRLGGTDEQGDVVGPRLDALKLGARHAQEVHDHHGRQRIGEICDEVDRLAGARLAGHLVQKLAGHALDRGTHGVEGRRPEEPVAQAAQPRVLRRIVEHHPGVQISGQRTGRVPGFAFHVIEERRQAVRRQRRVEECRLHVVVAGQHPTTETIAPVNGVLVLEPLKNRKRIGVGVAIPWIVSDGHDLSSLSGDVNRNAWLIRPGACAVRQTPYIAGHEYPRHR